MSHFNIPIFIPHLGCPFQCIFCNQQKITAVKESVSVGEVKKIIDTALQTLPEGAITEVSFFGGSFTAIDKKQQEMYLSVVKPYLKKGLISGVRLSTRPDFIDHSKLEFLSDWGVKTIELGVQSLDDKVLTASGRGYKSETVYKAVQLIRQHHFQLGIQLMVGLPGDDLSADLYTTKETIILKPDMVRIYPTLVIDGTPLAAMYREGRYQPLSLKEAIIICMKMYLHFQKEQIKVIRMGLHPEEELTKGNALLAGPFHPSFGELVMQAVFKEQAAFLIKRLLGNNKNLKQLRLFVNSKDLSKLIGNHKNNIRYLKQFFDLDEILITQDPLMARDSVGADCREVLYPRYCSSRSDFIAAYLS